MAVRLAFMERTVNSLIFAAILLLVLVAPQGSLATVLSFSGIRKLGTLAYSAYLIHPIFLCVSFRLILGKDPSLILVSDLVPVFVAALSTAATAWLSWVYFERPLLQFGHGYKY